MLNLTEEQIAVRDTFARFTDAEIIPAAEAIARFIAPLSLVHFGSQEV